MHGPRVHRTCIFDDDQHLMGEISRSVGPGWLIAFQRISASSQSFDILLLSPRFTILILGKPIVV